MLVVEELAHFQVDRAHLEAGTKAEDVGEAVTSQKL